MQKPHHVFYVPGFNDHKHNYEFFINRWSKYGVIPHVHRIGWHDEEHQFQPKLEKLLKVIRTLLDRGDTVSLVGGSAGGSAVLNVFLQEPRINAVVNLCGRLRAGTHVFPSLEIAAKNSLSFMDSVNMFERNEPNMSAKQRSKVLCLFPIWDEVVPKSTATLKGANNQTLFSIEHMLSGFLGVTLFAPTMMEFIKNQTNDG